MRYEIELTNTITIIEAVSMGTAIEKALRLAIEIWPARRCLTQVNIYPLDRDRKRIEGEESKWFLTR